jgi:polysaccharide biosynthesis transport protein
MEDLIANLEPPAPAAAPAAPAGVMFYLRALRSRALLLCACALIPALGGWWLALHQQKIYQARTTLELLEPGGTLNVRNLSSSGRMFGGDTYIETQVAKLRSTSLLKTALGRLENETASAGAGSAEQPVVSGAAFRTAAPKEGITDAEVRKTLNDLDVWPIRGTSLVGVSYDAPDPHLAARFVNILTDEYIRTDMDARAANAEQTRDWLQKQLEDAKAKLEISEAHLQKYANSSGLLYTSPKGNVGEGSEDKLQYIAQQLSASQAKRAALQARYDVAATRPAAAPVTEEDNPVLQSIQAKLLDLQRERASLASRFTPEYSKYHEVNAEIAQLQASQAKEYTRWLAQLRQEYETEQRHEDLLQSAYQQQASLVSSEAVKAIHYNVLRREVETNRNLYESLLGGMKEAGVNAAARVSNARVVDPATPPRLPYRPNAVRNSAIGLISGLLLGMAFVLVSETGDRRVKGPGIAPAYLNLPELGVIPSVNPHLLPAARAEVVATTHTSGLRRYFLRGSREAGPVADAFHTAVTSLFMSGRNPQPPGVVVVSSAIAHEGKSTVVGNLGLMAAQIGKRVLLIDGDMRNAKLHHMYKVSNERGLTSLLLQEDPLEPASILATVQPTTVERLYLLPGGPPNSHLLPLLHSERMPEIVTGLRGQFDLILIDTPPVLPFSDARVFGRLADAVILVVRSGVTSRNLAMAAKMRFMEAGLPVIGTILNGWNRKQAGYDYDETAYRY